MIVIRYMQTRLSERFWKDFGADYIITEYDRMAADLDRLFTYG